MHRFHQLMKNTVFHPRLVESIDVKLGGYRELIVYLLKKKKKLCIRGPIQVHPMLFRVNCIPEKPNVFSC